jgi:hypothetical protein
MYVLLVAMVVPPPAHPRPAPGMLQALMRGQVVEKMRRQVACAALCVR